MKVSGLRSQNSRPYGDEQLLRGDVVEDATVLLAGKDALVPELEDLLIGHRGELLGADAKMRGRHGVVRAAYSMTALSPSRVMRTSSIDAT